MERQAEISPERMYFAVFCIEALADDLNISGDEIYKMLTESSDILDGYILECYDALHTQGKQYIVEELKALMRGEGVAV